MYFRISLLVVFLWSFSNIDLNAQFSHQDTLRGTWSAERSWWDLKYYHLDIKVDPSTKSLDGSVEMMYEVLESRQVLQIDLQAPLKIKAVNDDRGNTLNVRQDGNAHFVTLKNQQKKGAINTIIVHYAGKPTEAKRPPWDGGITWTKDENGKPFIHSTCQGIGASIWWPCKDHMADEPDSVLMSINVPEDLLDVSNGKLRKVEPKNDGTKTWHWFVGNPISNYVININIGDYVHFAEKYKGEKGILDLDYYVLPYNLEKAKKQFKDVPRMMEAFEHWFGPYPFYEDGFKLVDVSYPGMEHQSSVTYGNGYENGYGGRDGSGTGHGYKFDFIIIHESGHEWFANNITYKDVADMWIHESFTNYSESLFLDYHYGKKVGQEYVRGTRKQIGNYEPIIGTYGVNKSGSGDMYVKGGNMLNTIRAIVNDDEKWRSILRGLNEEFYHHTVTTEQIEGYIIEKSGEKLQSVFDQYLRDVRVPMLEYFIKDGALFYRWGNAISDFEMPVDVFSEDGIKRIYPQVRRWNSTPYKGELKVDPNYYISVLQAF
ncbi:M1 family metallopeptidase [Portibacter lacus]|uniref:Peptidase M1 n=1 Tax=Portibacter lacus TaxID=1099794 RepID=A0AA37SNW6_9BACT|nr:M1 family metallopeptidase [Portibacter lacus]GLR18166.1 peptidase M1 [Portibacter lacus]